MVSKYYHLMFLSFYFHFVGLNLFLLLIIVNKLGEIETMEEISDSDFEQNNWHLDLEVHVVDIGGFEYWVSRVGSWYLGMRFQLSYRDYEFSSESDKMLLVLFFFVPSLVLFQFLFEYYFRLKTGPLQAVQLLKKVENREAREHF